MCSVDFGRWVGEHWYNFYTTAQVVCERLEMKTGSYCRCSCAPTISVSVYVCLGGDDGVTILSLPSVSNRCLFLSLFSHPTPPTLSSPSLLLLPRWCLDNFANQDISSGWVNITFYCLVCLCVWLCELGQINIMRRWWNQGLWSERCVDWIDGTFHKSGLLMSHCRFGIKSWKIVASYMLFT